jgi:hypothetical protein
MGRVRMLTGAPPRMSDHVEKALVDTALLMKLVEGMEEPYEIPPHRSAHTLTQTCKRCCVVFLTLGNFPVLWRATDSE